MDMFTLFISLAVLLFVGFPVALSLALSSLIYLVLFTGIPDFIVIHRMISGLDSFTLLAVPFFILVGNLMNDSGITHRIFDFAKACVGWMPGGLGHVNVGASVVFAGMSGAAVADAGGLGNIEIKAMRDNGYDPGFAVGITAASSTIGPIIPPSLPMVIYGVLAGASIGQLFAAGLVPGMLMAVSLMVMVSWYARKYAYPRDAQFSWKMIAYTFKRAFLPLLAPVIIVLGILLGVFTPTEAAVAACAYSLFLGACIYRTLTIRGLFSITKETLETTAIVMLIVAAASIFSWILTSNQITEKFATLVLELTDNKILILIMINLLLLVVGCFMETIAAITILVPVLLPLAVGVGVDPVHFGVMMVLNLMLGLLTPPVGMVLYVLSRVSGVKFERCVASTAPFLIPLVLVLLLVTFIPQVSMLLPEFLYR